MEAYHEDSQTSGKFWQSYGSKPSWNFLSLKKYDNRKRVKTLKEEMCEVYKNELDCFQTSKFKLKYKVFSKWYQE